MEELDPWTPIFIMIGYFTVAGIAIVKVINKYYDKKFKKMRTDREKRKERLQALRRKNEPKV